MVIEEHAIAGQGTAVVGQFEPSITTGHGNRRTWLKGTRRAGSVITRRVVVRRFTVLEDQRRRTVAQYETGSDPQAVTKKITNHTGCGTERTWNDSKPSWQLRQLSERLRIRVRWGANLRLPGASSLPLRAQRTAEATGCPRTLVMAIHNVLQQLPLGHLGPIQYQC